VVSVYHLEFLCSAGQKRHDEDSLDTLSSWLLRTCVISTSTTTCPASPPRRAPVRDALHPVMTGTSDLPIRPPQSLSG
jgi:hypothetical protein